MHHAGQHALKLRFLFVSPRYARARGRNASDVDALAIPNTGGLPTLSEELSQQGDPGAELPPLPPLPPMSKLATGTTTGDGSRAASDATSEMDTMAASHNTANVPSGAANDRADWLPLSQASGYAPSRLRATSYDSSNDDEFSQVCAMRASCIIRSRVCTHVQIHATKASHPVAGAMWMLLRTSPRSALILPLVAMR